MLASMFVLTPFGIAVVTLFAAASAFTVMATRRIVLVHGAARFGGDWRDVDSAVHRRDLAIHALVALPIVIAAVWRSIEYGEIGWGSAILGALAGTIAAVGLTLGAVLLNAWLADATQPLPDLVIPRTDLTRRLHGQKRGQSFVGRLVNRVVGALRPFLGPGYVDEHGRPLQAHLFASALLFVFLLVYAVGYFAWMPGTARGAGVPALVYLLTIGILANWFLSGVAFYLDRYHLPTLLPLVAWTLLIWGISRSDHYFELRDRPRDAPALALPAQVAVARPEPLLTVIASDGGGAQAAGWAATVLTGIQERWPGFQGSTRLISAVSGGSVGTMYFVASLRADRSSTAVEPPRGARSDRARQLERSGMGTGLPRSVARADVDSSLVPLREGPRMGDGAGVDARLAPSVAVGDAGRCQRGLAPVDCAERDRRGNGRALRVRDVRRTAGSAVTMEYRHAPEPLCRPRHRTRNCGACVGDVSVRHADLAVLANVDARAGAPLRRRRVCRQHRHGVGDEVARRGDDRSPGCLPRQGRRVHPDSIGPRQERNGAEGSRLAVRAASARSRHC